MLFDFAPRRFSLDAGLIDGGFIALNGQAGHELRGGLHVFFPFLLSSMFGRMMPDTLERLKQAAPAARKPNGR